MKRFLFLIFSFLLLPLGCGDVSSLTGQTSSGNSNAEDTVSSRSQNLSELYNQLGVRAAPQDAFPVLNFPEMDSVEKGDEVLRPDQWVIGISHNGEQKAYPIEVMGIHELGNDVLGGKPITVCW